MGAEALIERYAKKVGILKLLVSMEPDDAVCVLREIVSELSPKQNVAVLSPTSAKAKVARAQRGERREAIQTLLRANGPMSRRDILANLARDSDANAWRSCMIYLVSTGRLVADGSTLSLADDEAKPARKSNGGKPKPARKSRGNPKPRKAKSRSRAKSAEDEAEDEAEEAADGTAGDDDADDDRFTVCAANGRTIKRYNDMHDARTALKKAGRGACIKDTSGLVVAVNGR